MLIGALSKASGLSRDTIRFYEKCGLISVGQKDRRHNNYKEYSGDTLRRLLSIKRLKYFGFTLNEIAVLLEMFENNEATCNNVSDMIEEKIRLIDHKIQELLAVRGQLLMFKAGCTDENGALSHPDANCPVFNSEY